MRLIDADNLLNALDSMTEQPRCTEDVAYNRAIHNVEKIVKSMSAVDPVKHGRFVPIDNTHGHFARCSVCGEKDIFYPYEYCPWCGAKMDSEVSE